jgi:hypothetical protein
MDTETLNEYLFADLVTQWALGAKQRRLAKEGVNALEARTKPLITADLQQGLRSLRQRRAEVLALLAAEVGTTPPS